VVVALRLRPKQAKAELGKVKGWKLRGKRISRAFVFEDFMQVVRFVNRLAKLAEGMNHHPDMAIQYNKIRLSLTTHDEGGLTTKDFKLAREINRLKSL
jgi:4a-hydroxytetrahydrobiopterin dehydratase